MYRGRQSNCQGGRIMEIHFRLSPLHVPQKRDGHWEKQQTWGVQGLQRRPYSRTAEPSRTVMPSQRVIGPVQPRSQVQDVRPSREVQPRPRETVNPPPYRLQPREAQWSRKVKRYSQSRQSREGGSQGNLKEGQQTDRISYSTIKSFCDTVNASFLS